jgi:hypothetical protein
VKPAFEINVAKKSEIPGVGHSHYFKVAMDTYNEDAVKQVANELQHLYPTAKITIIRWETVGKDVPR